MGRLLALMICLAGPALAEPVSEREARGLLFGVRGESIAYSSALTEAERGIVAEVIRLSEEQMRQPLYYYAAIAYAPDEGLVSGSLQSAINHHGVEAADRAALAACAAAKTVAGPCRIAARVLPRRYEPRALELSLGATTVFEETYRRERAPKAMAISPATGQYAVARGADAAEAARARCNAGTEGVQDCRIVIAD
jgi:hypothetical protein